MRSTILAATVITALCGGSASADMRVYYHQGSWDAFSGRDATGKDVCGAGSTNPVDNRSFSLRFEVGSELVSFTAKKPSWNIPADTDIPVVMQLGLDAPWNVQARGNGQIVQWTMDRNAIQTFDEQFRRGSSMTLSFPNGNEPPWTIGLNGSTAVSNAFGRCVTTMTQQQTQQAPMASTGQPSGATQPFGATPSQPFAATPADQQPTQLQATPPQR